MLAIKQYAGYETVRSIKQLALPMKQFFVLNEKVAMQLNSSALFLRNFDLN
jgi:hypothetical protein